MLFENEITLYNDIESPIAKKFQTQDTKFEVIQGYINAIISETELKTLVGGESTMYTKLNNVEVDVSGIHETISSVESTVSEHDNSIVSINSSLVEFANTIDGLSYIIQSTRTDLDNVSTSVTRLSVSVDGITTEVATKVGESDVLSLIDQQADSIRLKADKIAWDSTYSSMTENGELTCRRINIASESQSGYTLTLSAGQLNSQSADKLRYTIYWASGQSIYQRDTINDEWVYTGFFGTAAGGSGPVFDTSSKDQVLRNQMSPTGFTYYSRASVSDSWHPIFKVSTYNNADGDATVQIGRSDNHQYMSLGSSSFALYRTDGTPIASIGTSSSSFSIESYDSLKSAVLTPTYLSFRKRNSKNDAWTEVKRYS